MQHVLVFGVGVGAVMCPGDGSIWGVSYLSCLEVLAGWLRSCLTMLK